MREIRASGLRPGDQFAFFKNGAREHVCAVERTCTGPVAGVEVWPASGPGNGWWFDAYETVWVDR